MISTDILFERILLMLDLLRQRAILFDVEDESIEVSETRFIGMFEGTVFVLNDLYNGTRMELLLHKIVV